MKVLFISTSYSRNLEDYFKSQCRKGGALQYASNTFQHSVIDGLLKNNVDFDVISIPGLPSSPSNYHQLYTIRGPFLYNEQIVGTSEKYCTLAFIKRYSIKYRLRKYVRDWIKQRGINPAERFAILTYQPSASINGALTTIKKKYSGMVVGTIVADFYDYNAKMVYARKNYGLLKRIQSHIEGKGVLQIYPSIDKYILLTEAMQEGIPEAVDHNIVMEGLANEDWISDAIIDKSKEIEKIVAYTGQLGPNSCVNKLVDAFMLTTNANYRLVITGKGLYTDYIIEQAKKDSRIIYKGIVTREEMIDVQRKATILVNPRTPSTGMTRFTFPSKIMEYMAAGTPVLTYKLDGIPEEYYDVCYSIDKEGTKELANKLEEILSLPSDELKARAEAALSFLKTKKVARIQVARIIDFLKQ